NCRRAPCWRGRRTPTGSGRSSATATPWSRPSGTPPCFPTATATASNGASAEPAQPSHPARPAQAAPPNAPPPPLRSARRRPAADDKVRRDRGAGRPLARAPTQLASPASKQGGFAMTPRRARLGVEQLDARVLPGTTSLTAPLTTTAAQVATAQ